jgi:Divergent InlB B-repeat domain
VVVGAFTLALAAAAPAGASTLVVTHPTPGGGVVTTDPPGLTCETFFCGAEFAQGSVVSLIATPRKGFAFAGYTDACTGPTCRLAMDGERRVTVTFVRFGELPRKKPRQVTADGSAVLTVRVGGPGRLTLSGEHVRRKVVDSKAAANVGLPVVPKGEVAERLEDGGTAKVAVRVAYRPTDGTRAILTRTVPLKRVVRVVGPRR